MTVMAVLAQPSPTEILRPSQAVRWANCSGSHALEPLYPEDEESAEAREGTAAHYYVTEALYGRVWPVATLAPNGHPITDEMVECGELYLDDVRGALASDPDNLEYYVEAKVYGYKTIHPRNEGTPDTFVIYRAARHLIVWDYKYGHRYVDPFRNEQMMNYVGCIFETFGITREEAAEYTVSIRVIQPRNFHRDGPVRRWDTTGRILVGLIDDLSTAAYAAKSLNPQTQTGSWCRDCSARRGCDAFMRAAASAMDTAGDTMPHDLPPRAVGIELRNLKRAEALIKARMEALEEQALAVIAGGKTVPHFSRGYVQGREKWTVPAAEVFALGDMMGTDLRAPQEPLTPSKARKLVDPAVIRAFTITPTGAAKIISDDTSAAAKAFGNT
jgi:hypothetical protein